MDETPRKTCFDNFHKQQNIIAHIDRQLEGQYVSPLPPPSSRFVATMQLYIPKTIRGFHYYRER